MIRDSLLKKYTQVLTDNGYSKEKLVEAFRVFASEYHLAQLNIEFSVSMKSSTTEDEVLCVSFPLQEEFIDENVFLRSHFLQRKRDDFFLKSIK